jgi:tubulin--tyrosine ligase
VIHHEDFGNTLDSALDSLALKAAEMGFDGEIEAEDRDDGGTGVMTSQLRHFVIHVCPPSAFIHPR